MNFPQISFNSQMNTENVLRVEYIGAYENDYLTQHIPETNSKLDIFLAEN